MMKMMRTRLTVGVIQKMNENAETLRAMTVPLSKFMRENPELSPFEAICCFYFEKCGMDNSEIAAETGREFNTVRNARSNASKKRKQKTTN